MSRAARSTVLQLGAGLAGLLSVLGGVGGLAWWSSSGAEEDPDEWRPRCTQRLGWDGVDVERASIPAPGDTVLFGLDRSGSNAAIAEAQLDAALETAAGLDPSFGVSVLLIGERSDDSTVPDFPLEAGRAGETTTVAGLSCWPDCPTDSLFAQRCAEQLDDAVEQRARAVQTDIAVDREAEIEARRERLTAWRPHAEGWAPGKGTSLLRFFDKVADLPVVRDPSARVTLVVLSDLEEARSGERKRVEAMARSIERSGQCPDEGLPRLEGVDVLLVQSLSAEVDGDAWAGRWSSVLGCTGARVTRHRYGAAVPLPDLVAGHLARTATKADDQPRARGYRADQLAARSSNRAE